MRSPVFESGDIVVHDEYGIGEVRDHPDASDYPSDPRNYGTYVWFFNTDSTTINRVFPWKLRKPTAAEATHVKTDPRRP